MSSELDIPISVSFPLVMTHVIMWTISPGQTEKTALQNQKAATAHLKSIYFLAFHFAMQYSPGT